MLPSYSKISAETISIASTSVQQRQSISFTSLLQCPHFRSSRPELLCKKDVLKNFAEFLSVSSVTGVSCKFCKILKNTFFHRTLPVFWHLYQSKFPILILYDNSHKKKNSLDTQAVFMEFLKYVENSGVVVYWGDGSFKMASKSEELLAGDDIEGILAAIDNDILTSQLI